jgi:hypothetical protein
MQANETKLPVEIDCAVLTAEGLWGIFLSKPCYGGALAYAVLSRATKMGCVCSVSLEKLQANRMKQRDAWFEWCSFTCNMMWARHFSFQLISQRASYKTRIRATWSEPVESPLPALSCSEFTIPADCVARIASLALHADGSKLLDQVLLSACDERRIIISELWLKIKKEFVCNALWQPSFEFSFIEVRHIRPNAHCNDQLSPGSIADTWCRIVSHLKLLFLSTSQLEPFSPDNHTVWSQCICSASSQIPVSERAVIMWIWLLWSSNPLPFFLSAQLRSAPAPTFNALSLSTTSSLRSGSVEDRLGLLTALRNKRLITNSEFKKKRLCIISTL